MEKMAGEEEGKCQKMCLGAEKGGCRGGGDSMRERVKEGISRSQDHQQCQNQRRPKMDKS